MIKDGHTYETNACRIPNKRPGHRQNMVEARCPENCSIYPKTKLHSSLTEDEFSFNEKGEMCLTEDGSSCKKVQKLNILSNIEKFALNNFELKYFYLEIL